MQFFDKNCRGTYHNLKMNNGYVPMHIHKRLTFKVEFRMCTEMMTQKRSLQNDVTRQICIQLFETILTWLCAFNGKKTKQILSYAFFEDDDNRRTLFCNCPLSLYFVNIIIIKTNVKINPLRAPGLFTIMDL